MCWACSPTCGACKPKQQIVINCPLCGSPSLLNRGFVLSILGYSEEAEIQEKYTTENDVSFCEECGCSLLQTIKTTIEPVWCNRVNAKCAYPCGQFDKDALKQAHECAFYVQAK